MKNSKKGTFKRKKKVRRSTVHASEGKLPVTEPLDMSVGTDGNDRDALIASGADSVALDQAKIHWLFGSWNKLASLNLEAVQHHPERHIYSLMKGSAHQTLGDHEEARRCINMALDWGCNKELVAQVLLSDMYNTLGRATAIHGKLDVAYKHFRTAIKLGSPDAGLELVNELRAKNQISSLDLPPSFKKYVESSSHSDRYKLSPDSPSHSPTIPQLASDANYDLLTDQFIRSISMALIHGKEVDKQAALEELSAAMQSITKESEPLALSLQSFKALRNVFQIVHVTGDYIPQKIASEKTFYETNLLDILSFFHHPKGVIIDVGANIGNHTLYFAGVLGAEVIAVEPEPHNAVCLSVNVAINELTSKVKLIRHALGREPGRVTLQMNINDNYGSFTAKGESNPNRDQVEDPMTAVVPVMTIDQSLSECIGESVVSIIKLDVEGMESEVLEGADNIITLKLPIIVAECFCYSDLQQVEAVLKPYNYFPMELTNATPTFIFLSRDNPYHIRRFSDYHRSSVIGRAKKRKGFQFEIG